MWSAGTTRRKEPDQQELEMDSDDFEHLGATLLEAGRCIDDMSRRIPPGRWDDVVHTGDGPWTRRQLLAHMAANDLRQLIRIRLGAGVPEPGDEAAHEAELDVHAWNAERVAERAGRGADVLLAEMHRNRQSLISLLDSLTPQQLDQPMPFRGVPTPLAEMIPTLIGHLDVHASELVSGLGEGSS